MKKLIVLVLVIAVALVLTSCSKSVVGKYTAKDNPSDILEFKSDGTWTEVDGGQGTFEVDGDQIKLTTDDGRHLTVYVRDNGNLIFLNQTKYVKQ